MCLKKRCQRSNKTGTEKSLLKLFHFISNNEEAFVYKCRKINMNYLWQSNNPAIQISFLFYYCFLNFSNAPLVDWIGYQIPKCANVAKLLTSSRDFPEGKICL